MAGEEEEKKKLAEELHKTSLEDEEPLHIPQPQPQDINNNNIVLTVFMHCEGCARKVRRCLKGFQGVESVETDWRSHRVVVKGEKADPLKVLGRLQTKTHRRVQLISPIPEPQPQPPLQIITLVLKLHMHCHACAHQIKTRIHRIKGVQSVEADLKSSQVRVKGAIDPAALLQYVHRRTGKHAAVILNQDPPEVLKPPLPDHNNNSEIIEPAKDHDQDKLLLQDKKEDVQSEKMAVDVHEEITKVEQKAVEEEVEEAVKVVEVVNKNEYNNNNNNNVCYPQRYIMAPEMYPYPPPPMIAQPPPPHMVVDAYPPPPVIGPAYPPQMFSDDNPNACSLM